MWSIVFVDHNWFSRLIVWRILRSSCFEVRDSAENHFTGVLTHKLPLDMLISLAFAQFWKEREREHHLFLRSEPGVVLSQNISRGGGDKRATCKSGISCNVCTATARRKWVNVRRFKSWFSPKNHESSRDVPVAILVSCMCSLCQHQLGIIWITSVCSCPQLRSPSLSVIDSIFSNFSTN